MCVTCLLNQKGFFRSLGFEKIETLVVMLTIVVLRFHQAIEISYRSKDCFIFYLTRRQRKCEVCSLLFNMPYWARQTIRRTRGLDEGRKRKIKRQEIPGEEDKEVKERRDRGAVVKVQHDTSIKRARERERMN